jgi:hypothetical protein
VPDGQLVPVEPDPVVVAVWTTVAAVVVPCVAGTTQTEELQMSPVGQTLPHPPQAL